MKAFMKINRLCLSAVVLSSCALALLPGSASAIGGPTVVTFKELEKGATFHFLDNPPEATLKHGVGSISPGDMVLSTNPLEMEGKIVGKIRIACTATSAGSTRNIGAAGFICTAIAKIPGGTLVLVTEDDGKGPTVGAVTGGTGTYAGAQGTFVSRQGRDASTNTVTLLE
jgi:hypothetical protein